MIIRVSEIADEGLVVANPGEFVAPFADRSWRLEGIRLHVVRDGVDVLVAGELAASVPLVCSRCLEEFRADVHPAIDVRYVPKPVTGDSVQLGANDLDLDFYENDERSEEHTSELQSLAYLVCRLLLEKKKPQPPHPP